jgi:UDP-N-acetylglucosamine acyltransferase
MLVDGNPARPRCVNVVALKRNDFNATTVEALTEAHRVLYRNRAPGKQAAEELKAAGHWTAEVAQLFEFLERRSDAKHGRAREQLRRAA